MSTGESQRALSRVPIVENGEPLVDFITLCPALRFSERHPLFDYERVRLVRQTVAEMLCRAQALLPAEIGLEIVEGWRAVTVQEMMYRHTYEEFRRRHPAWPESMLRRQTNRFSAPPTAPTPPPHLTGGAVDLHLVGPDGGPLDMTSPYDLFDRRGAAFNARDLSDAARRNRALLAHVLTTVGLTNYAAEWWHWDYGNSGWAIRTGRQPAIYGSVAP